MISQKTDSTKDIHYFFYNFFFCLTGLSLNKNVLHFFSITLRFSSGCFQPSIHVKLLKAQAFLYPLICSYVVHFVYRVCWSVAFTNPSRLKWSCCWYSCYSLRPATYSMVWVRFMPLVRRITTSMERFCCVTCDIFCFFLFGKVFSESSIESIFISRWYVQSMEDQNIYIA